MTPVSYQTIEFHRFGGAAHLLSPDNKYIRTAGWDEVATEIQPSLDHREFLRHLNKLRYGVASTGIAERAQTSLAAESVRFLDGVKGPVDGLLQVDLVTGAAELWAFPFEACYAESRHWLEDATRGVEITRRIRGHFSDRAESWPVIPRVLFLHAPPARDLTSDFIATHVEALHRAVAPWCTGKDAVDCELLVVQEIRSTEDISHHCIKFRPTYIHVLAHGAVAPSDPFLPDDVAWGLRLDDVGTAGLPPEDIAEALRAGEDVPVVVTLAACDSGNQANSFFAGKSLAQELHRHGVPVVIGSQLPLTQPGSCTLTERFYSRLLQGEDVRIALHAARVGLRANEDAGHDWLSMVGYVRLPPEGYASYLQEVRLRVDLRLLEAAQVRADALSLEPVAPLATFDKIDQLVRERLHSLKARKSHLADRQNLLSECSGLEASANKRLAELLFVRGEQYPQQRSSDWQAAIETLRLARDAYRTAYESDLQSHWLGVQWIALEVVLNGQASPHDVAYVEHAAERARKQAIERGKEVHWAHGTLAELSLLAPRVGGSRDLARAAMHLRELLRSANAAGDPFPIRSTWRQLNRYARWWTKQHGFFSGGDDLQEDARELLKELP